MSATNENFGNKYFFEALRICVCLCFFSLSVGTAPLSIFSISSIVFWFLSGCYRNRTEWVEHEWIWPLILLIFLPWVAIIWSSLPAIESIKFAEKGHYWLFAFVSASTLGSERRLRKVMIFFVSGTTLIATLRFLHYRESIEKTAYLEKAFVNSYITFSLFIVVAVILLAFFYKDQPSQFAKISIATLMVLLSLALTQSNGRSGYLALILLSPWIALTMFGKSRVIPVCCVLLLVGGLMFSSQRVRDRVSLIPLQIKQYQVDGRSKVKALAGTANESSVGLRLIMWNDALNIFKKHPIFGAGTGAYLHETRISGPDSYRHHPHNSYLYVAASFGLFGIGIYCWLLFVTLRRAWKFRNHLSGYCILAFLFVILIGSLTDTQILSATTGIALGFVVGIPTTVDSPCVS